MTQQPTTPPIDERLATLLEIEQRLEARYREAQAGSEAALAAARAALREAKAEGLAAVEALVARQEAADVEAHQRALRTLEEERTAALRRLTTVTPAELDRLARLALSRVLGGGS